LQVCIAIEKFDPTVGGAERYCWDLAHYLAERGHALDIICMHAQKPEIDAIHVNLIKPVRFPQALRHLSFAILQYLKAQEMPAHIHFCVGNAFFMHIYQPHGGLHKAWFVRENLRYSGVVRPCMHLIKRLSPKDMVQRGMEWWVFRMTQPAVIAISRMVADDIRSAFSYPAAKLHLIPNGIDTGKFSPENRSKRAEIRTRFGLKDDEFVFVFVANNFLLKGYYVLIDACLSMDYIPFKVLVIGEPDCWARSEARLLSDTIVFGGRVHDLEYIYPACDCLVHPTYYDACSLVVIEALASGIPVITTDTNGASMFVGENGRIIPPHAPVSLANAMREMHSKTRKGMERRAFLPESAFRDSLAVFAEIEALMEGMRGT
jgi:UDP-glucose:(heptosyl)LPS alpha-1,3-glucosyltransferase